MRRKPWARPELADCPFYIKDPLALRQLWHYAFPKQQPICLELGCGKGGFLARTACDDPDTNYIGIDIKSEVLGSAKRCIETIYAQAGRAVDNLLLFSFDIARIPLIFSETDVISRIYINFPNPWPKERHKKRRLTHPRQLKNYRAFLPHLGEIHFKTDDRPLFEDTLEYLSQCGYGIRVVSRDYHSDFPSSLIQTTEHEEMFMAQGLPIYYIEAQKEPTSDDNEA